MILNINDIREVQRASGLSVIKRRRVVGNNTVPRYYLCNSLVIMLTNGVIITIPKGFVWDLSSVPRFLWSLLPPDSDAELGIIIHDYLYVTKIVSRRFADNEMLLWSKATSGTLNKVSIRNFDNQLRYIAVRLFGWIVWNKGLKKNKK